MKELNEKLIQLNSLKELKEQAGWALLTQQVQIRLIADQIELTSPPEKVGSEKRTYLAGKIQGTSNVLNLVDELMDGLQSEIELLREKEKEDASRDPEHGADSSDDILAGASRDDPLGDKPDPSSA